MSNQYSPSNQRVDFTPSGQPTIHGKPTTYNRGCRCEECRRDHAQRMAECSRRRKQAHQAGEAVFKHGTANGYFNYKCRCPGCKAAGSEKNKMDYENRKKGYVREFKKPDILHNAKIKAREEFQAGKRKIKHGTTTAYKNYNCRCDKCKEAQRTYRREYKARKKEQQ